MAAETIAASESAVASAPTRTGAGSYKRLVPNRIGSAMALVIAVLWTVPTFGLFISSLRPESAIKSSGWWTILSDPQFTLDNYERILAGATSTNLAVYFQNSVVIAVPATVAPLVLAIMAS